MSEAASAITGTPWRVPMACASSSGTISSRVGISGYSPVWSPIGGQGYQIATVSPVMPASSSPASQPSSLPTSTKRAPAARMQRS